MSKYYRELEQRTEEWFKIKNGKVGGSTTKDLMIKKGLPGSALLNQILADHMEEFFYDEEDQPYLSKDVERGNTLEPFAIEELEKVANVKFLPIGWVQSKYSLLGISPDGLSEDNKIACEVKCPSAKVHVEYLLNKSLPLTYIWQIINYFASIDDLELLWFASYRPENNINPLFNLKLTKDSEVNIGTIAKPVMITILEGVAMVHNRAIELETLVTDTIESLEF